MSLMNQSMKSDYVMSGYCEAGNCSTLNSSTCSAVFENNDDDENNTETLYDEDGCFHTHSLRNTSQYQTYIQVNSWEVENRCFCLSKPKAKAGLD